jgi:D-glycero-D-manno-heptose 1,7-bisphosphate phosphatase
VNSPADVIVFEGVPEVLKQYKRQGWSIAAVSNQGGVALGFLTERQAKEAAEETNRQCGYVFDVIRLCFHNPHSPDANMQICQCRKPLPGMIVDSLLLLARTHVEKFSLRASLMVGDRDEDQQCAKNAGVPFQWAEDWRQRPIGLENPRDE